LYVAFFDFLANLLIGTDRLFDYVERDLKDRLITSVLYSTVVPKKVHGASFPKLLFISCNLKKVP